MQLGASRQTPSPFGFDYHMDFMADQFNVRDTGILDVFLEGHLLNVEPLKMREKPLKE